MSWVCPHCDHAAVIRDADKQTSEFELDTRYYNHQYQTIGIVCPNPNCKRPVIYVITKRVDSYDGQRVNTTTLNTMLVEPKPGASNSRAKEYPDYVPDPILKDYTEACAIVDLSPKSSATLARRALQGMIRDFWDVKQDNLSKAIKAIEDKVTPDIWEAIDGVRKIGNIGAHMEKDINLIIDVSPEEATLLIEMIEMLLDDWYVARHDRQQRILKMKELADTKSSAKKQDNNQPPV